MVKHLDFLFYLLLLPYQEQGCHVFSWQWPTKGQRCSTVSSACSVSSPLGSMQEPQSSLNPWWCTSSSWPFSKGWHPLLLTADCAIASYWPLTTAPIRPSLGYHTITFQFPKDRAQVEKLQHSHPGSSLCQSYSICQSQIAHGTEKNAWETEPLVLVFSNFLMSF